MIIQFIKFETTLTEDEAMAVVNSRLELFRATPGLIQKYYVKLPQPNHYGGIYVWDSKESLAAFRQSELAASIPVVYKVKGQPVIELLDVMFPLRD